jgi:fumarate hydratase class II
MAKSSTKKPAAKTSRRRETPSAPPAPAAAPAGVRIEKDSMGEMAVPADRLWGATTKRAVDNFQVSGRRMPVDFLRALAAIKWAAAKANEELGDLDGRRAQAVRAAADQVIEGKHDDQFPIDVFQTGSATSTNMNMNEVIANLANVGLGGKAGQKEPIHPNDVVNMGQSSNDAIPTALHVAVAKVAHDRLIPALGSLSVALLEKAKGWDHVVKVGRTHLQDATPITLGQVFRGYASQVAHSCQRLALAYDGLLEVALGGTAVGTGIGRNPQFHVVAIRHLAEKTRLPLRPARNFCEQLAGREACVFFEGALAAAAAALHKIANDVRHLGSGPRCGLGELRLPPTQPGSSIMPGKVNPVMAESLIMACLLVQGHATTVNACGAAGNFELNVTLPLLADVMLDGMHVLAGAVDGFRLRCIRGLEADVNRIESMVDRSLMVATALAPHIGYDAAAALAKEAHASGKTIRELATQKKLLPPAKLAQVLDLLRMTVPGRE